MCIGSRSWSTIRVGSDCRFRFSPRGLQMQGLKALATAHRNQPETNAFWSNLKEGYDLFEASHRLATVKTRRDGTYESLTKSHRDTNVDSATMVGMLTIRRKYHFCSFSACFSRGWGAGAD